VEIRGGRQVGKLLRFDKLVPESGGDNREKAQDFRKNVVKNRKNW
jgi:hypothetical protein